MLNVMRDNLRHLKWVLGAVALSMLFYLGAYFDPRSYNKGAAGDWAAKVDGKEITRDEFLVVARRQDENYRRMAGAQYEQIKKSLQIGSQAIQGLIDKRIVIADADKLGLRATREEISRAILEDPSFKDPQGNFIGKDRYTDIVGANFEGGVEAFERSIGETLLVRKWADVMASGAQVSDEELKRAWTSRNVRAGADYVYVPASAVTFETKVTPAETTAWYEAHRDDYKRPEGRKLRLLVIDRQTLVAKTNVKDADVKADYDQHAADYTRPEQRHARHILLKVPPGAAPADKESIRTLAGSILTRVKNGEDFAALAKSMSQDPVSGQNGGDLGWFGHGAMVKAFDDAVFATSPGQFAPVVETEFGFHVIQVLEERPAGTTPFDEVKDSIRKRLELQKAQDLAVAEADKLRSELKSPADFDAVAAKADLKVEGRTLSADDHPADLGPTPEFSSGIAALQPNQVSNPLPIARGFAIAGCTEIVPPSVRSQSEVLDRIANDILNDRGKTAALAAARKILAASSLDAGAKAQKLEMKKSGDLTSGALLPSVGRSAELDAALFGPASHVGSRGVAATPGGAVVYEITRHDVFDPAKFESEKPTLRDELLQQQRNQMTQGFIEMLRQEHVIEINQPLVDSVNG
ncbi:MAG TPA: peptidyl-prolyl cis-trans isomerase [Candidatus Polarisedimenticolaceae bacterium]|nr:peptidyl-prolyl cis-trans isomerase [Candidatus Polarisedimenticolaceae bacterium]